MRLIPYLSQQVLIPIALSERKYSAEMVLIPAGSFEMGDAMNETEFYMESSRPVHMVTLDGFYMDSTEVTNGQLRGFYGTNEPQGTEALD